MSKVPATPETGFIQAGIYNGVVRLVELNEELGENYRLQFFDPVVTEHFGYSDRHVVGYGLKPGSDDKTKTDSAEYRGIIPEVELDVYELQEPLVLHGGKGRVFQRLHRVGTAGDMSHEILNSRRTITVPYNGNMSAAARDIPHPDSDFARNLQRQLQKLNHAKLPTHSSFRKQQSQELQQHLGWNTVWPDEAGRLKGLVDDELATLSSHLNVPAAEGMYGIRASQEQMRAIWKAAYMLLRASSKLVIPHGMEKTADSGFADKKPQSETPTVGRPNREQTYARNRITKYAGEAAAFLGVDGPVTVRNTFKFHAKRPDQRQTAHAATLRLTYAHTTVKGDSIRTINLREHPKSGLIIARVDGLVPYSREDRVVDSGRHLTAEEGMALEGLLSGLGSGYDSERPWLMRGLSAIWRGINT